LLTAALAAVIIVLEAMQQLFQWQTNWVLYPSTTEALKHETFLFLSCAGPYTAADRLRVLAERVEGLVSQEYVKWDGGVGAGRTAPWPNELSTGGRTRRLLRRTLALPLPLVAALHAHKAAQLGERMLTGSEWHDEDLVFAQPNGRPIDKRTDYDDWSRLLKSAGVRHVRLHDGRHTAATLLLTENVHPRVVMELLGHSQMRTTMDIYSHVMPALAREAADRMSALLLPGAVGATATTTATEDESGRPPKSERPAQRGGAEGTRTPDPHTARPS
jgi:integrase